MPNLIHGQDPGGAQRPIQVDDNGNLSVDLVSGVTVSATVDTITSITNTVGVNQVSGAVWSTTVTNDAASLLVNQVSGSAWSTSATIVGSTATQAIVGDVVSDAADTADAPVKTGGVSRTTNPTAVGDGDRVSSTHDDLGRQVITLHQVRDLVATAYLALSTGTEATLLAAGGAGVFHDLIYIMAANQSDAAVDLDIRDATAGGVVLSLTVPADSTAGVAPTIPIPQNAAALPWTADMGDITGTTVNITALFVKNV